MEFLFFWIVLSIFVGVFASVRRNRCGVCWTMLSVLISPLLAGLLVAILHERPSKVADFLAEANSIRQRKI
jgi:hypothetical protein